MNIIVNVDRNWAIGNKGKLLFPLSQDLKRFKDLTTGRIIIMGRKTFKSLPDGKPLADRINVVLSRKKAFRAEGAAVFSSPACLVRAVRNGFFKPYTGSDFFVIGGEQIYRQFLPFCDKVYVTKVEAVAKVTDTFFPNLDENKDWKPVEISNAMEQAGTEYRFVKYIRLKNTARTNIFT